MATTDEMDSERDADSDDDEAAEGVREIVREELAREQLRVSRRSFLASLVGAAGVGAAGYHMVQPVEASSHSGNVGSTSNLARIWAETIRDSGDNVVLDVEGGTLDIEEASFGDGKRILFGAGDDVQIFYDSGKNELIVEDSGNSRLFSFDLDFNTLKLAGGNLIEFDEIRAWSGGDGISTIKTGTGDGTGVINFTAQGESVVAELKENGSNGVWEFSGDKVRVEGGCKIEIAQDENSTLEFDQVDVRNISSPEEGDVGYHNGSGNAGKGLAYYDGNNWNVLDGGTQP